MAVVRDTSQGSPNEKSMDIDGVDSDMVIDEACIINDHCLHLELISEWNTTRIIDYTRPKLCIPLFYQYHGF